MAIQPNQDPLNDLNAIGPDATAAFEPAGHPAHPADYAGSDNLGVAGRKSALDEEDEVEDEEETPDDDDLVDDDLEDDEEDEDEIDDDDLEDDDDEDEDEDDEEDEDEEEDDVKPLKV